MPSSQQATRRSKRWRKWAIAALVIGGLCLALAWRLGYFVHNPEFRAETETILRELTGGEASATAAYDDGSFPFRETALVESFVDRADRLTKTLGTFEGIVSVEETEMLNTVRGHTARVAYELKFSLVQTPGELSYLRGSDGVWRLLGFSIRVPSLLEEKVKKIDSEYERIKAPDEVLHLVDATLSDISAGKAVEVRNQASPPFRESKSEDEFLAMLARHDKELGRFQRRLAILKSGQNAAKNRATVSVLLQYEKNKTTGTFEYMKVDEVWRLLIFKVEIPEPLLKPR